MSPERDEFTWEKMTRLLTRLGKPPAQPISPNDQWQPHVLQLIDLTLDRLEAAESRQERLRDQLMDSLDSE